MKTGIPTNGSMVKNHVSLKMVPGFNAMRRTTFQSWSPSCLRLPLHRAHRQLRNHHHTKIKGQDLFQYRLIVGEQMSPNGETSIQTQPKIQKSIKMRITHTNGVTRLIPQEFRENLVDGSVPDHRDSQASSSHETSLESKRGVVSSNHSLYTHFPKNRNCEFCQRTKITRAPCRRRINGVVHRAEKIRDLTTADQKILSESCESRNNHRYAIVVQDLATQWMQSYPCNAKTSQETERSLQKFLEPSRMPKVIYTDNSLDKACEDLSWSHCSSSPHRSETNWEFPSRRWNRTTLWVRSGTENINIDTESTCSRRKSPRFS